MAEKKFHQMQPGEVPEPHREIVQPFIDGEVRRHCQLYDESGDPSHLWRAWRTARAAGHLSPACLEWLAPRLDSLAAPGNETRAEQRDERAARLRDYYHELDCMLANRPGCAASAKDARNRVAKRHDTDERVIDQLVLQFEGRGQRGKGKKGKL